MLEHGEQLVQYGGVWGALWPRGKGDDLQCNSRGCVPHSILRLPLPEAFWNVDGYSR